MTNAQPKLYRKATVKRLDPQRIAKLGEVAFEGNFNLSSDIAIILHFAGKMANEGYETKDYSIELTTVQA